MSVPLITCKHFGKRSVLRIETDYASGIIEIPKGIYEALERPFVCKARCRGTSPQYISTLKKLCPVVGGKGCRSFAPLDPPQEFAPDRRGGLLLRYIGPLGDPEAEAEAERIGNVSVL